ncbi:osteocrin isoform X2 [Dunckerocampus dactyliophorus]|uniref:osteocrin isoform X2 n=2 Tax=Dunckerocampus dactyliophorus TaxID=161453 RepID=UPI002404A6AB|nr:osteocrin isoform X2 [Dunckerocampus dactyliophorus]
MTCEGKRPPCCYSQETLLGQAFCIRSELLLLIRIGHTFCLKMPACAAINCTNRQFKGCGRTFHVGKGVQEVLSQGARQTAAIKPDMKSAHGNTQEDTLKMYPCGSLLFFCLLAITVNQHFADQSTLQQHVDRSRTATGPQVRGSKLGVKMESDIMELKRRRSFPVSVSPLDRLSIGAVASKHASSSQVIELPRRRLRLPPIDRIGMRHLPNRRG